MNRRHIAAVSTALAVALSGAVSPVRAAPVDGGPFSPPAPFHLREDLPTPFVDVTGSIKTTSDDGPDVALRPPPAIPDLGIAPPDVPPPPVLDAHAPSSGPAGDLAAALTRFTGALAVPGAAQTDALKRRQADRDAIAAFYGARGDAPLWIDGDHFSAAARSALSRIDRGGEDGLTLQGFAVPALHGATAAERMEGELALSEAVVAYAEQARGSRIDPLSVNRLITAKRTLPEVAEILTAVSGSPDAGATLQSFNPPQPGYAALRSKLAELRQATPTARGIPGGPTVKLGMRDARVPLVRSRFGLGTDTAEAADDLVYDTRVAAAVADFQRANGLPASGALTPRTVAALSGGNPARLEGELVANMERWRWVPRDLGADHIMVNVPDYSLELTQGGAVTDQARVVVGKPDHQTPIFSNAVRFIIVNPYWNVPLSIIKKEMLPKLAANPNYFADHGYEVVERNGVTVVRQPPGEDNALGRIKFMFPNEHAVYLHDTNARALFGKTKRAFSHGCVRVDQPFRLASAVLGPDKWSEKRISKLVGGDERTIMLPAPLPIHIVYFTAFVDDRGSLQLRDDLYGYSEKVKLALGLKD